MNRIKTGIEGLDQLIDGGFLENRTILIQGDAGTGKSTLALQYLIYGAMNDEPGVLLSMEYETSDIVADMRNFGWEVDKLLENNTLKIVSPPGGFENPEKMSIDGIINLIFDYVQEIGRAARKKD